MKNKIKNRSDKGFTLIELLVVIAIIGILASLLVVNFVGIRERSRDAQRKSNLRQIQSALELYRADNGRYPNAAVSGTNRSVKNCPAAGTTSFGNAEASTNPCSIVYMKTVPKDPSTSITYNGGEYYYEVSGTNNTGYELGACIENANDSDPNITPSSPGGSGSCTRYYVLSDL